jgi:hypothetical protein
VTERDAAELATVAACGIACEFCNRFKTNLTLTKPVSLGAGLQSLTPTVASNMPGVVGVTTTLLSTSVGHSHSAGLAGRDDTHGSRKERRGSTPALNELAHHAFEWVRCLSRPFQKYGHMKSRLSPPCVVASPCRTKQCGGGLAPSLAAKSIDFIVWPYF